MDYRASMIPTRPQAGRWEQLLEVLNGLSASQAPQMPTMGGAMGALKSYGASLPQSPEDMIGKPNPNLPMPQQVDPRQPWGGIGLAGDYDSAWLEKSLADRQAHYGQQPKVTPGPSLEETNPILMGTETAGIGDIPVGNRMTPGRRWNEGLAGDPLGATRMSQPIVGGAIPPDANDLRQEADLSQYQGELSALDAMSARAKPIVESLSTPGASTVDGPVVPSRQKQLMAQLDAMPNAPDSTREAMIFAALNTGAEDRASGQGAKPYQSVRKYADGYQDDLADRKQAVRDRAQRKGQAREVRMGGGEQLGADMYMRTLDALNSGGGGAGAAGPGSPPNVALMAQMGFPSHVIQASVQAWNAQQQLAQGDREIAARQEEAEARRKAAETEANLNLIPPDARTPAMAAQVSGKPLTDDYVASLAKAYISQGMGDRQSLVNKLLPQVNDEAQVIRVLDALAGNPTVPEGSLVGLEPTPQAMSPLADPSIRNAYNQQKNADAWRQVQEAWGGMPFGGF
jgi:hypothetical protein